jgi:hypothetical protein
LLALGGSRPLAIDHSESPARTTYVLLPATALWLVAVVLGWDAAWVGTVLCVAVGGVGAMSLWLVLGCDETAPWFALGAGADGALVDRSTARR